MKVKVREAESIPDWYGDAYYSHESQAWVCYPVPLNILINWLYRLKWHIKKPPVWLERDLLILAQEQYDRAYRDGYTKGFWNAVEHPPFLNSYERGVKDGVNLANEIASQLITRVLKK
jgi:hypothetical protein